MRLRSKASLAPKSASDFNVLRQGRRVHLRAGRKMAKSEHLQQAVHGLQQRFVAVHGHKAFSPIASF
eukprot:491282-Pleurochrysis_carterae.AAC.2